MDALNVLRTNARLRVGVVVIVAICVAYGLLEWRDQQAAGALEYRRMVNQLSRLTGQPSQQPWPARAAEAQQALADARGRLWENSSTGRAQAQVQDWLNALLRQTAAKAFSVKVAEGDAALDASGGAPKLPDALKDLTPLRARIEFTTEAPVLLALLAAMNDAEHQIVVDSLSVKPTKTEIGLSFWFVIRADAEAAADTTPPAPASPGKAAAP